MKLLAWQKAFVDIINNVDTEAYKQLPYSTYYREYRHFEVILPRRSGKTRLVQYLASVQEQPVIFVADNAVKESYPDYLQPYCYIKHNTNLFMPTAVFYDEVPRSGGINFIEYYDPKFYTLRVSTL